MSADTTAELRPLFSWRSAITESNLPPGARLVAFTLSLHMNERGGSAFPTVATLCRESGLSERTVREHLRALRDKGWLVVIAATDGRRGTEYAAATPYAESAPLAESAPESTQNLPRGSRQQSHPELSRELSRNSSSAPDKPPRKRDELFEALCSVTGTNPNELTKSGRGPLNRAVKELRELEATPTEVRQRAGMLQRRYPNITLTAPALVKHWATLGHARSLAAVPDISPEEQAEFDALLREVVNG